ncbi:MAG TPA: Hpt domain-containing protein [Bacteroidales bacterium]|nr:Hpt domain-containing protein [Bacteroidales bacterium]
MEYKLINPDYLDNVSGGDVQIISEIVEMFRVQAAEISEEMQNLHESKEYVKLGLLAHKAKSSVAIMGMNDLAVMLKTFELSAREGKDIELYSDYIGRFVSDTRAAIIELDELIRHRLNTN